MKRMFVVTEVIDLPGCDECVQPFNPKGGHTEVVSKSRVIYADEMKISDYKNNGNPSKMILLEGVSSSPEADPWEEEFKAIGRDIRKSLTEIGDRLVDWLRKMPREKGGSK